jgi:phage transcriptional activator, RinA family
MKQTLPKSKIKNPWPKEKRWVARKVIEWDLFTYESVKKNIERVMEEIGDMAAPSATDIRENIYTQSKQVQFNGGFNTSMVIGRPVHGSGDPTSDKAESIRKYRQVMLGSNIEYKESVRRINAIEEVLGILDKSAIQDNKLRAQLIREYYFKQEKTLGAIADDLHICERTARRWRNKTIYEIAKRLGFII